MEDKIKNFVWWLIKMMFYFSTSYIAMYGVYLYKIGEWYGTLLFLIVLIPSNFWWLSKLKL